MMSFEFLHFIDMYTAYRMYVIFLCIHIPIHYAYNYLCTYVRYDIRTHIHVICMCEIGRKNFVCQQYEVNTCERVK